MSYSNLKLNCLLYATYVFNLFCKKSLEVKDRVPMVREKGRMSSKNEVKDKAGKVVTSCLSNDQTPLLFLITVYLFKTDKRVTLEEVCVQLPFDQQNQLVLSNSIR